MTPLRYTERAMRRRETGGPRAEIEAWFDAGNSGSPRDIAKALGLSVKTVRTALNRLQAQKVVKVWHQEPRKGESKFAKEQLTNIWGLVDGRQAPTAASLVSVAMERRTPLEVAWGARA